jgi:hypothetical protein
MNTTPPSTEAIWRRRLLGVFALILLGWAAFMFLQAKDKSQFEVMLQASLLRGGLLVAAVWLAYPQLLGLQAKLPTRTVVIGSLLVGILVVQPKLFVIVGPLLLAYGLAQIVRWVLAPLPQRHSATRSRTGREGSATESQPAGTRRDS